MFEARLLNGSLWKKIIESIKDVVEDANWECSGSGISLQGMDSSHVALVSLHLKSDAFDPYRCDRNISLGLSSTNLSKILKCSSNDDSVIIRTSEASDNVSFIFESSNSEKVSQFDLKLMNIDSEHLGIPDMEYDSIVKMPSNEFQRICRDLSLLGESVQIACTKDGVQFTSSGSIGSGKISLRPNITAENLDDTVNIELNEAVLLTFALRYLNFFTKATSLAPRVILSFKTEHPLVVEYQIQDIGYLKFYLAPKIEDDDTKQTTTPD
ncbi:hypothetical protein LOD99_1467 [Oopsacas minuta]|uniref:DNA sliding clamp PCNA n=1 Tax=Oopsacas minuta TaxID=111878 RepID=A0AAV7K6R1_9METZ|nr:hypothetical protein LOD99_1467 [Oopsacas minuta]